MKVWKLVKEIEERKDANELGQARATMIVNYGPEGQCHPLLVTEEQNLLQMMIAVFEYYEGRIKDG